MEKIIFISHNRWHSYIMWTDGKIEKCGTISSVFDKLGIFYSEDYIREKIPQLCLTIETTKSCGDKFLRVEEKLNDMRCIESLIKTLYALGYKEVTITEDCFLEF